MTEEEDHNFKTERHYRPWAGDRSPLAVLRTQLDIGWRNLAEPLLDSLTDADCLWEPVERMWTVREGTDGRWAPDWEWPEPVPAPLVTVGWLTWHMAFWWKMVNDHSFGSGTLRREHVLWPGDARRAAGEIRRSHDEWVGHLNELSEAEFDSSERTRWPYEDGRTFGYVVSWVNVEFTKNMAEIRVMRDLHHGTVADHLA